MEGAVIRFDGRNIVTISLCAGFGYLVFLGLTIAWAKVKVMKGMPS